MRLGAFWARNTNERSGGLADLPGANIKHPQAAWYGGLARGGEGKKGGFFWVTPPPPTPHYLQGQAQGEHHAQNRRGYIAEWHRMETEYDKRRTSS